MPHGFDAFAAIDWSGAAVARPPGLALAWAERGRQAPVLLAPVGGWSRGGLLDWIAATAARRERLLIGIDLSAAFPFADYGAYFPGWSDTPGTATALWEMVDRACADEPHLSANHFLALHEVQRHFRLPGRLGDRHPPGRGRLRMTEAGQRAAGLNPYSCFNLVGAAQVGKSSLTGMRIIHRLRGLVPVWPFDPVPRNGSLIVEIYTALAARQAGARPGRSKLRDGPTLDRALAALGTAPHVPLPRYTDHATDAILSAAWLRANADRADLWCPIDLSPHIAATEGWTFGIE